MGLEGSAVTYNPIAKAIALRLVLSLGETLDSIPGPKRGGEKRAGEGGQVGTQQGHLCLS